MTNSPVLEVRGLTVHFGSVKAVNDVSLTVNAGSMVGLIGTNGAGKTTALDALTGFVRASGSAEFNGEPLLSLPAHRRTRTGMARTWQSLELFDDLTVMENVLVGAASGRSGGPIGWLSRRRAKNSNNSEHIDQVLTSLEISEVADLLPTELSQGQRKMVVLARALAMRPTLLLADEPAAGLDTEESQWLGGKLRRLRDEGLTIVLVDHDMGLVLGICDYIYVLDQGLLIAAGTPEEIRLNPAVLDAYLGRGGSDTVPAADAEMGAI